MKFKLKSMVENLPNFTAASVTNTFNVDIFVVNCECMNSNKMATCIVNM